MASYTQFLGRIVTVQYRAGDMVLSAHGSFVGDSGRSIFLEQHVEQRGKRSYFRWEIPYQYIHRIEKESEIEEALVSTAESSAEMTGEKASAATAAQCSSGTNSVSPFSQRSKPA